MSFILASQSPRRKELLGLLNIPFTVHVADIDETLDGSLSIPDAVAQLSLKKAQAVPKNPWDVVIAADTVVVWQDTVLGKPKDADDAFRMLSLLSGKCHRVITGLTVLQGERVVSTAEVTEVFFRPLSEEDIRAYLDTGDYADKAGSYGIQGGGALFVEKIQGDYFNVVGLPVCRLSQILKQFTEEIP